MIAAWEGRACFCPYICNVYAIPTEAIPPYSIGTDAWTMPLRLMSSNAAARIKLNNEQNVYCIIDNFSASNFGESVNQQYVSGPEKRRKTLTDLPLQWKNPWLCL